MKELDQFETKEQKIKYLIENKRELISIKKSERKYCDAFSCNTMTMPKSIDGVEKSDDGRLIKTIVGNTYNWMDSHDDVHLDGVFSKSIKEKSRVIFHLRDHEYKLSARIGEPIKIFEQEMAWKTLGHKKSGNTQALIMKSEIINDTLNKRFFDDYKAGRINQHSVGMQYVKLDLAVDKDFASEFFGGDYEEVKKEAIRVWDENFKNVANKERAKDRGFFWAVKEAKLIEISAVLIGSNELTPTIEGDQEPLKGTPEITEAAHALQQMKSLLTILNT